MLVGDGDGVGERDVGTIGVGCGDGRLGDGLRGSLSSLLSSTMRWGLLFGSTL